MLSPFSEFLKTVTHYYLHTTKYNKYLSSMKNITTADSGTAKPVNSLLFFVRK
jgi:hypothetical protein